MSILGINLITLTVNKLKIYCRESICTFRMMSLLTVLAFLSTGCGLINTGPSDKEANSAITEFVLATKKPVCFGSTETQVSSVTISERGQFNDKGGYWPVKARVQGVESCIAPFTGKSDYPFDEVEEFSIKKNDFGKWQAYSISGSSN